MPPDWSTFDWRIMATSTRASCRSRPARNLCTRSRRQAYVTEKSVKETSAALNTLLTAKGWEPYGNAGDSSYFKKNAVRLSAWPSVAPAQGGKTMIQFAAADVGRPARPPVSRRRLRRRDQGASIQVDMTPKALAAFYKEALGKAGWKSTTESQ